ncbi:Zeaxanthin epoxidase, chloroplastic [Castilleja foliolosa]|uniref:Zeaxanthin epoxidase, chloroplastic n=1 Tax=Castilleja foliolosa TaxID=1961234 RepID=A0ABD3CC19_9LAMI
MASGNSLSQRLLGKVALVTGGASGIGESIVRLFHKHGARVCIADIQDDIGQRLCNDLGGPHVSFSHCNVAIEDDVKRAVDHTVEKFGSLDIMVNNAGILGPIGANIRVFELSHFEQVFDVNVKGAFLGMKHAARIMVPAKKGSIISMCSISGIIGGIGSHAYTGSKHAVLGLTRSVACELGKHGVRVNCVSPYGVPTNMLFSHMPEERRTEEAKENVRRLNVSKANLSGVELTAEDVGNAVVFLASDEARYISGDNLVVDGGFSSTNNAFQLYK